MSSLIKTDKIYSELVGRLCDRFKSAQIKASVRVNEELIKFYYYLGQEIVSLRADAVWGASFISNLSADLKKNFPNVGGFSITNLNYAKRFYLLFSPIAEFCPQVGGETKNEFCPQVGGELFLLPWGHHKVIIDKCSSDIHKAVYFLRKSLKDNWSRSVLLNLVSTDLYQREGKAVTNFSSTLPEKTSDLAQEITKDPYCFDFLSLTEPYKEKELKDALMSNLTKFLLELGTGFAFLGREYRIEIGSKEKFIDMLFYNLRIRSYVVVEIKTVEFDSDHIGQLATYVTAVNHQLKTELDNPTIGLLICKEKDNVLAKYAVESSSQPIGISEYELQKILNTDIKGTLPTIEEIEKEIQ